MDYWNVWYTQLQYLLMIQEQIMIKSQDYGYDNNQTMSHYSQMLWQVHFFAS